MWGSCPGLKCSCDSVDPTEQTDAIPHGSMWISEERTQANRLAVGWDAGGEDYTLFAWMAGSKIVAETAADSGIYSSGVMVIGDEREQAIGRVGVVGAERSF